jgi:hypothetical protein
MRSLRQRPPSSESPDHLEDLRELLPAEFRDAPDHVIAELWAAWTCARHGHSIGFLTHTFAVTEKTAEKLIAHASAEDHG